MIAVFGQAGSFEFVNYDDQENVYENPVVEKGLSAAGAAWAFTHTQVLNWVPLTTLSHMLDCQLFGLRAGGHHLVNVLLHAANAVLLFLLLRQMTGRLWPSAFVAAVFAVHPLRAESVAWVSERKDVLSGFFFLLTIWAYVRQARKPSKTGYVVMAVLFAFGLLAKSMVATLPFVLLLLDYWPLGRWHNRQEFLRLAREKIPLFALAVGACAATLLVPGLVVPGAQQIPLVERAGNALVSYVVYLWQLVFPFGLAVPYPMAPKGPPHWEIALAILLLAAITVAVVACRNKHPCLLVGWLWYLGMLVPVIGLVQISHFGHADRYTYLPEIGLVMAAAWGVADWSARWRYRKVILGLVMLRLISALMVCAYTQCSYWHDSFSLWNHALASTRFNSIARYNLGEAFSAKGDLKQAIAQYQTTLQLAPKYLDARNNLGNALSAEGDLDGAIAQDRQILDIDPGYLHAHYNLGNALAAKGDLTAAIAAFQGELAINPNYDAAHYNLGNALYHADRLDEAVSQYKKALELNPAYPAALNNLGGACWQLGRAAEAIDAYRKSLQLQPDNANALNNLAWALATCPQAEMRDGSAALKLAHKAEELTSGKNPLMLRTLAAANAESGNYEAAIRTAQGALDLATRQKNDALAAMLQDEIKLYERGTPMRVHIFMAP